jgi:hypothetical protein
MKEDKKYVCIIEGVRSALESKNFLSIHDRIDILKITNPKAKVIYSNAGYIPKIIENQKINPKNESVSIYAGSDRINGYMKQFSKVEYDVIKKEIPRTGEDVSATKIRQSIKDDNFDMYKKMIAKGLDNEKWFNWFRKKLLSKLNEDVYIKYILRMYNEIN